MKCCRFALSLTNFLRLCKTSFSWITTTMSWFLCLLPSCPWAPLVCIQRCVKFQQVLWSCYLHAKLCLCRRPYDPVETNEPEPDRRPMASWLICPLLSVFAKHFCTLFKVEELSAITDIHVRHGFIRKAKHYRYMWLHVIACDCMCLHIFHGCDCATSFMMEFARFCKTSCWCGSAGSLCQVFAILAVQLIATTVIAGLTLGELSHSCYCRSCYYQNPLIISHYIIYTCNIYIYNTYMYIYMICIIYIQYGTSRHLLIWVQFLTVLVRCGDLMPRAASWGRARHSRVSTKGTLRLLWRRLSKSLTW